MGAAKTPCAFSTLVEMLGNSVARFPDRPLFSLRRNGRWEWMTYEAFSLHVNYIRGAMANRYDIGPGDKVAVICGNGIEWAAFAYATMGLGAAFVPLYEIQSDADWEYILRDSGAKAVFISRTDLAERAYRLPLDVIRVCLEKQYEQLLWIGLDEPAPVVRPEPDDLACLIYTSGTTGQPKGVMLTHGNIASNVAAVSGLFPLGPEDRCLSFLPWAHAFGQTAELHTFINLGGSIAICEGIDKITANLAEVRPTVLCAVPRIFNKIYAAVGQQIAGKPAPIRALFRSALRTAADLRRGAKPGLIRRLALFLANKLIFRKVRRRFGGKLRFAISGGAALASEVAEFIDTLGIAVYEGYGLSETSPIISCNYPGGRKIGSVGKPLPGVRVEIDLATGTAPDEGEIVVRGPNVMRGYHHRPEEDRGIFAPDRGLRTGDLGRLDDDGFLFITGRIKEQYKLENGKYIAPAPLEERLKLSPLIANVMICGDNRPFNVALVFPDRDAAARTAGKELSGPDLERLMLGEIEKYSSGFRKCEHVRKIALLGEDFTQANGMLTPTLKLKRNEIVKRFGSLIAGLYS